MASSAAAARIERAAWLTYIAANGLGAVVIVAGAVAGRRLFPADWDETNRLVAQVLGLAMVWFLLACSVGKWQVARVLRPYLQFWVERRPPNTAEQRGLYRAPTRIFWHAAPWWIGAGIWTPLYANAIGFAIPGRLLWKAEGLIALGFLFANAISFLLIERQLRPLFALALRAETPVEPVGLGVVRRLLVVWFAAAAAPLLAVTVQPIASTATERSDVWPAVLVVTVGAMAGGLAIVLLAGNSLQEPLRAMRSALRRVEEGELDVEIEVADASEIGLVQAGFNRTVAALRERDRLREVFGHHVGADVAAQALAAEGFRDGEVRKVSVLFVDLVASTALSQRQAPGTVVRKLNAFFDAVVTAVEAEGGWVNKFEGDAALCIFGAPGELADHADCALRAALRLRAALVKLAKRYPDVDAAIGVSTGEVVAGNIGAKHRYEYTVIGDAVNEASRLTDEAKGREERVLASAAAVGAAASVAAHWVRAGRKTFRGRANPTSFYVPVETTLRKST
jgi:adenylate cyclase